jgi:hypothetical protein
MILWSASNNFVYTFPVSVTVGGVSQPISHCQNDNQIIIDSSMAAHSVQGEHDVQDGVPKPLLVGNSNILT